MKRELDRRAFLLATAAAGAQTSLGCRSRAQANGTFAKAPAPHPRLGINLAEPTDYATELPFVDIARLGRPWISQLEGAAWGQGPPLTLDANGWVARLGPGASADMLLLTDVADHVPRGTYTVLYEGQGKLEFRGSDATPVPVGPGHIQLRVSGHGGFAVRLLETSPQDHLRNIRVIRPGFEKTYLKEPWHPDFLDRWRGMAVIRFSSFQHTVDSKLQHWSQRTRPDSATFSEGGVPIELMIDLANRWAADPWLSIPHQADDDFVLQFASLVHAQLGKDRSVWVEYSNETWNTIFGECQYAAQKGRELGLGGDSPSEAAAAFTTVRSLEIFAIWEKVFGGSARLKRVLPSQASNSYLSEKIVSFRGAAHHADVLAIAPYFGLLAGPNGKPPSHEIAGWTLEKLFDYLEKTALLEAVSAMRASKAVADRFGLSLVGYEGGQHLVGIEGGENDQAVTDLFLRANADPRMGQLYRKYFAAWAEAGGDLLCHYHSVGRWDKWGSWGLLQYHDDPPHESPKYTATLEWAKSMGQATRLPGK